MGNACCSTDKDVAGGAGDARDNNKKGAKPSKDSKNKKENNATGKGKDSKKKSEGKEEENGEQAGSAGAGEPEFTQMVHNDVDDAPPVHHAAGGAVSRADKYKTANNNVAATTDESNQQTRQQNSAAAGVNTLGAAANSDIAQDPPPIPPTSLLPRPSLTLFASDANPFPSSAAAADANGNGAACPNRLDACDLSNGYGIASSIDKPEVKGQGFFPGSGDGEHLSSANKNGLPSSSSSGMVHGGAKKINRKSNIVTGAAVISSYSGEEAAEVEAFHPHHDDDDDNDDVPSPKTNRQAAAAIDLFNEAFDSNTADQSPPKFGGGGKKAHDDDDDDDEFHFEPQGAGAAVSNGPKVTRTTSASASSSPSFHAIDAGGAGGAAAEASSAAGKSAIGGRDGGDEQQLRAGSLGERKWGGLDTSDHHNGGSNGNNKDALSKSNDFARTTSSIAEVKRIANTLPPSSALGSPSAVDLEFIATSSVRVTGGGAGTRSALGSVNNDALAPPPARNSKLNSFDGLNMNNNQNTRSTPLPPLSGVGSKGSLFLPPAFQPGADSMGCNGGSPPIAAEADEGLENEIEAAHAYVEDQQRRARRSMHSGSNINKNDDGNDEDDDDEEENYDRHHHHVGSKLHPPTVIDTAVGASIGSGGIGSGGGGDEDANPIGISIAAQEQQQHQQQHHQGVITVAEITKMSAGNGGAAEGKARSGGDAADGGGEGGAVANCCDFTASSSVTHSDNNANLVIQQRQRSDSEQAMMDPSAGGGGPVTTTVSSLNQKPIHPMNLPPTNSHLTQEEEGMLIGADAPVPTQEEGFRGGIANDANNNNDADAYDDANNDVDAYDDDDAPLRVESAELPIPPPNLPYTNAGGSFGGGGSGSVEKINSFDAALPVAKIKLSSLDSGGLEVPVFKKGDEEKVLSKEWFRRQGVDPPRIWWSQTRTHVTIEIEPANDNAGWTFDASKTQQVIEYNCDFGEHCKVRGILPLFEPVKNVQFDLRTVGAEGGPENTVMQLVVTMEKLPSKQKKDSDEDSDEDDDHEALDAQQQQTSRYPPRFWTQLFNCSRKTYLSLADWVNSADDERAAANGTYQFHDYQGLARPGAEMEYRLAGVSGGGGGEGGEFSDDD